MPSAGLRHNIRCSCRPGMAGGARPGGLSLRGGGCRERGPPRIVPGPPWPSHGWPPPGQPPLPLGGRNAPRSAVLRGTAFPAKKGTLMRPMRRIVILVLAAVPLLAAPAAVRAAIYHYQDEHGVHHFTNAPTRPGFPILPAFGLPRNV